jgi:subtilisin family serine protease
MDNMRINTGQYISGITPKETDVVKLPKPKEDSVTEWQQPVGDTVNINIPVEMPPLKEKKELPPPPMIKEIVHKDKPAVPAVPLNLFMEDPVYLEGTDFAAPMVTGLAAKVLARNPGASPAELKELILAEQLGPFGVGEVINRETAAPGTEFFSTGLNSFSSIKDGMFNVDGEKLA